MSTRKDPLIDSEAVDRVVYATGVLLDADDFSAEQTYHRGRLARALAYLHGSGTVAGLFVKPERIGDATPAQWEIAVEPGLALDPLGRLIEIPSEACIRVDRWYAQQNAADCAFCIRDEYRVSEAVTEMPPYGVVADLFVRFLACERGKTPAFAAGPFDATDAVMPSRLRDGYELRLVLRPKGTVPVPTSPWPAPDELASLDHDVWVKAVRAAVFHAWRGRKDLLALLRSDPLVPDALKGEEEADVCWVLLARVVVGVDPAANSVDEGGRPLMTGDILVDNDIRPFAVTTAALARWLGF